MSTSPTPQPTDEQISELAYHYWLDRGCPEDSPETDWFRACEALSVADALPEPDEPADSE